MMAAVLMVRPQGLLGEEGQILMNGIDFNKQAANIVVWLLLLAMPFWLPGIGGYVELGSRILSMRSRPCL